MGKDINSTGTPATMRNIFGIIMILAYLGMAALFFCGFFNDLFYGKWAWVRWFGGALFTVYGLWRAYRQFKGIDPGYGNSRDDESDD